MKPSMPHGSNVVPFTGRFHHDSPWVRLAVETDNLSILYSNKHRKSEKYYSMKILCWALQEDGTITAVVPWMNTISDCHKLNDEYYGKWQGYYDPCTESLFDDPPEHKMLELNSAADYFGGPNGDPKAIVQEIPDTIGTHVMLNSNSQDHLILTDVLSWRLYGDGRLEAMIIDEELVEETPILTGSACLYPASENPEFRYFFQHHIANQIKSEDPEALAAIALLLDR